VGAKLAEMKKNKEYKGSFSCVCHFFGYQGRCALPSRLDQNLAVTYGRIARVLVLHNMTGFCPSVRGLTRPASEWFPIAIPFTHMLKLKEKSQFGINKPIIRSADVSLQSASFRYFVKKRELW
jgi:6-phosphofructokinase